MMTYTTSNDEGNPLATLYDKGRFCGCLHLQDVPENNRQFVMKVICMMLDACKENGK